MIILRVLAAGASFLLCVLLGAVGGILTLWFIPFSWLGGNPITHDNGITSHLTFWIGAGAVVGALLGALAAYGVWSLPGRRSREESP